MSFVSIQGIEKRFAANAGVEDIDLNIEKGEALCLLGASGCGKTTLLRLIAGLLLPDKGRIHIDGRDVTDLPTCRRGIGMVFQTWALFPHLTVWKNIEFGLKLQHVDAAGRKRRVGAMLDLIGLPTLADRMPRQLSGGQQQRVALARALATNPGVLLLDEPMSSLDFNTRLQLRQELRSLQRDLGVTAIYVTHDYSEALAVADRTALMRDGVIVEQGPTRQLFEKPKTSFAASFLGLHNVLEGRVIGRSGENWQVRLGTSLALDTRLDAEDARDLQIGDDILLGFDQWSAEMRLGDQGRAGLGGVVAASAVEHGHVRLAVTLDGGLGTFQHRLPGLTDVALGSRCALLLDGARAWRLRKR
ncbi:MULTISPECIES: ABC transporter ATP-binding protein [unclassified Chelatococcus]|uniref:ABC transporter ATP-binding protein n=1 Tax=unclassified Chelatococcus TaxID=2638111 RepID=UPI001BD11AB7|nr:MULTISPECIES: ABC transporter ATP-binding protein [unclassified Chelatococcus]CAH1670578.1 Fe(3+) ions import ATP-binding protein FbpC [Hyphomicrobiales bacterium]MBS7739185.1 ABC transporter ATP-binding protein [Chelatococcus sp. HY11]MBX3543675.1 ABC transporter ATP-binding protein [Chelatococcus sp.]MCO5076282.1 ABC transporter ATP-binding protein [Chelatococcus sp.]CAH1677230.1 Fe(3+) ions import ATP-binding protein FbpC [Hyphomicrobiales bacterium]